MGGKGSEFEAAWCAYTGLPHSLFLNSATAGLELAFAQLKHRYGWADGDEVITTPITFVSTNHAILHAGLKPVFADIDQYGCLDPNSVFQRVGRRTRAIVFVGLGGNTGQYPALVRLSREHGLKLVLDAAHMAGTRLDGIHVGRNADVAVWSFQAVKNLPTADSGIICWADAEMDAQARQWSWLGISKSTAERAQRGTYKWHYDVPFAGWKMNGNSIMAAIGLDGLRHLDADNEARRQIAAAYDSLLSGVPGVRIVRMAPGCESSRHLYQVLVENREKVIERLNDAGVNVGVHYISNQRYAPYADCGGACPNADYWSKNALSLPLHLRLTVADLTRVADALRMAVEGRWKAQGIPDYLSGAIVAPGTP